MRSCPIPHVLLKSNRPPFVSILSVVRDGVARLPDGVGTRLDVTELCKDSQWVVPGGMDENLMSMTIGGGLDRLQAEDDPACRFDPATRLWVYLHRKRKLDDPRLTFGHPAFKQTDYDVTSQREGSYGDIDITDQKTTRVLEANT